MEMYCDRLSLVFTEADRRKIMTKYPFDDGRGLTHVSIAKPICKHWADKFRKKVKAIDTDMTGKSSF